MKKMLILTLFLTVASVVFISCNSSGAHNANDNNNNNNNRDKAPVMGAKVEITVKNALGKPLKGETVYMFRNQTVTDTTTSSQAKTQVVTDNDGIAVFDLNFTRLNILDAQTTLYFAVFYNKDGKEIPAGSTGITLKKGDVKKVDLRVPDGLK